MSRQVFLNGSRNTEMQQFERNVEPAYDFDDAHPPADAEKIGTLLENLDFAQLRGYRKLLSQQQAETAFSAIICHINDEFAAHLLLLLCEEGLLQPFNVFYFCDNWPIGCTKMCKKCFLQAFQLLFDELEYQQRVEAMSRCNILDRIFEDFLLPEYFAFEAFALRTTAQYVVSNATLSKISRLFSSADVDEQESAVHFLRAQLVRCSYDPQTALDWVVGQFVAPQQLNLALVEEQMDYVTQLFKACSLRVTDHLAGVLDRFCLRALCSSLKKRALRLVSHLCRCDVVIPESASLCISSVGQVSDAYTALELLCCCLTILEAFPEFCEEMKFRLDAIDISSFDSPEAAQLLRELCSQVSAQGLDIENDDIKQLIGE